MKKIKFEFTSQNFKKNIYPIISVLFLIILTLSFALSINFVFRHINKILDVNESAISEKLVKFNIDGFEKIRVKLLGKAVSAPQPEPVSAPTPVTPVLDKKTLSIKILNGTDKKGLAADLKKVFEDNGFIIKETGNTSKGNYKKTVLSVKDSKKDFIPLVMEVLKNKYSDFTQETLLESEINDVVVIIGIP